MFNLLFLWPCEVNRFISKHVFRMTLRNGKMWNNSGCRGFDALWISDINICWIEITGYTTNDWKPYHSITRIANHKAVRVMWWYIISITEMKCVTRTLHCFFHTTGPPDKIHKGTLIARFIWPTWGPSGADRTQVGPMLAPWTLPSEYLVNEVLYKCVLHDNIYFEYDKVKLKLILIGICRLTCRRMEN